MMKIILSHPTGNANVRAAAIGVNRAGLLDEFYTSIAVFPGDQLSKLAQFGGPFAELTRRSFDVELKDNTVSWPVWEIARLLSAKAGLKYLTKHEKGFFCVDAVYKYLDLKTARRLEAKVKEIGAVYAYEDGALYSFETAKKIGLACYYDLPIGYWRAARRLMEIELEKWPEWAGTLTGFKDSQEKLSRKDKELKLADRIFVASTFTAKTLKEYPDKIGPVDIVPYGFPDVGDPKEYSVAKPLKVLFVGGLSQRKGIAYLFEAAEKLKDAIELTLVGHKPVEGCLPLNFGLKKHKWIPSLPHKEILKLMRVHDVLVFPSLFEGFGLVITEAMSQGTPVITTDRTAGPDLIEHGRNGWIIKAGSSESLIEIFEYLLEYPNQISLAGKEAWQTAKMRPWYVYGQELAERINLKTL